MYTGKAATALLRAIEERRLVSGTVLFWHTGGQIGLFDKSEGPMTTANHLAETHL